MGAASSGRGRACASRILRGQTFNVGDRITMGGVRGDVIGLSFTQTTIMEMGQPPPVQNADPAMWVKSRQYTGRVVTVSNARVFDEPVYNYSAEASSLFPARQFVQRRRRKVRASIRRRAARGARSPPAGRAARPPARCRGRWHPT